MKRCGACRALYRGTGRRALAQGRFCRACPACAKAAVLVVSTTVGTDCACGATATLCQTCADRAANNAHGNAVASALRRLRAVLATFRGTVAPEDEREYVEGIMDGLERAIDLLERREP